MLLFIILAPFIGFLINATLGRRLSKTRLGWRGGGRDAGRVRLLAGVGGADLRRRARPPRDRADGVHVDDVGRLHGALHPPPRPALDADDPRGHRHRLADPHLLDQLHARGARRRVRPLLLVPEPLCRLHAHAGARRQLPDHVRRLGGRGALLVPAHRLLVHEEVGERCRQEGVRRQPHRRLRVHPRHVRRLRDLRDPGLQGHCRAGRDAAGRGRLGRRSR